jgi:hypothetical protein
MTMYKVLIALLSMVLLYGESANWIGLDGFPVA